MNIFAALRAAFPRDLDARAVETDHGLRYSWGDLERATAKLANLFASLGLPEGARIAVQVEKSVEALCVYLATLRAGFVFLPLNTAYKRSEMEYFIRDAEPAAIVCAPDNLAWICEITDAAMPHVFTLGDDRSGTLLEAAAAQSDQHAIAERQPDDLAAIIYTSGTTGRSKGAMLSHGNLLSNAQVLHRYWGWHSGDVLVHALPIFHAHGLFVALHGALLNGSRMHWLSRFDAKVAIGKMRDATVFMGVPTLYTRMLAEPTLTPHAVRNMRLFVSGSAPLLVETFAEWQERTGHAILERYGMSETVMLTSNPYYPEEGERRGGTVGRALPGVGVRLEGGGDIGGIEVRGPNVFQGYWRMPEKTRQEFTPDGWFKTGDVGRIDSDGYVTIVGRSKDLIVSGGYNVYPAEVEGYINAMPGVAESAVVGVPHPDFGEVGVAVVARQPGVALDGDRILAGLKVTLANFKIPKRCVVVDELPRNAMGKVQKNVLRAEQAAAVHAP